jgi:hypothetical protein
MTIWHYWWWTDTPTRLHKSDFVVPPSSLSPFLLISMHLQLQFIYSVYFGIVIHQPLHVSYFILNHMPSVTSFEYIFANLKYSTQLKKCEQDSYIKCVPPSSPHLNTPHEKKKTKNALKTPKLEKHHQNQWVAAHCWPKSPKK